MPNDDSQLTDEERLQQIADKVSDVAAGTQFDKPEQVLGGDTIEQIQARARAAQRRHAKHTPEGNSNSFINAETGRGMGRGLQIAYAIIGVPLVGFGVGWLIDRNVGGVLWQGLGTIFGATIAVIYAIKSANQP